MREFKDSVSGDSDKLTELPAPGEESVTVFAEHETKV
jgi:hypothetical protein